MATKNTKNKSKTTVKARVGGSKSVASPRLKWLYLLIFVLIFAYLGHRVFFAKAEGPVPSGASEIVAQYDLPLQQWIATKQPDGSVTNALPAGEIIVTGDGTLYCNTSGDGSVTVSNIGLGVVKQIYDGLNGADVRSLAASQNGHQPDYSTTDPATTATLVVHGNNDEWALTNVGDTTGVFSKAANLLQQRCSVAPKQNRVNTLPDFTDVNAAQDGSNSVSWLSRTLFTPAEALSVSYNSTETSTMTSDVNNYRKNHGVAALSGNACLYSYAYTSTTNRGAGPWTRSMALKQALSHDPNLGSEVNHCSSGNWTTYGQNVGYAGSVSSLFNAYLNSAEHKANILDKSYNRWGDAVDDDSNGLRWNTQSFAHW